MIVIPTGSIRIRGTISSLIPASGLIYDKLDDILLYPPGGLACGPYLYTLATHQFDAFSAIILSYGPLSPGRT